MTLVCENAVRLPKVKAIDPAAKALRINRRRVIDSAELVRIRFSPPLVDAETHDIRRLIPRTRNHYTLLYNLRSKLTMIQKFNYQARNLGELAPFTAQKTKSSTKGGRCGDLFLRCVVLLSS